MANLSLKVLSVQIGHACVWTFMNALKTYVGMVMVMK